jgi:ATP-dependent helicase/nuclease subunit A
VKNSASQKSITLPDADARRAATEDFSRPLLVEAAAGTGKTRLIVERIANILRRGLATMPQIVAITFTEKAAGELKIRVREWLEQELPNTNDPVERNRILVALRDLERAQVSTIHSFAAWMLKQLPVEAGVDPAFAVADALKSQLLRAEVWNEWFRAEASAPTPPESLRRALIHGLDLNNLHHLAETLCVNRDAIHFGSAGVPARENKNVAADVRRQNSPTPHVVGHESEASAARAGAPVLPEEISLPRAILRDALKILADVEPFTRSNPKTKKPAETLQQIRAALRDAEKLEDAELEKVLLRVLHYDIGKSARENWKPPEHYDAVAKASDDIAALRLKISDSILRDLIQWMQGFLRAYELRKQREALLDFDDLLLKARDLLRDSPQARQYFKQKFRFILIDEFQDTDPAQTEIALFLSEKTDAPATERNWRQLELEAGKLFIVGDPKQSIYRFRRADIEMYENAKAIVARGAPLTISANFRTVRGVTDWVNRVFAPKIQRPPDGFYQPDYVALEATRDAPKKSSRNVLLLELSDNERALIESKDAGVNVEAVRKMEANALAQTLKHLQGRAQVFDKDSKAWRPAEWRDMAILFRSLTKLSIYERALEDYGIPYQVEGGKDFFQRPEVRAVCSLLLCLDNPANTRELVAVLRSPIFGIPDEQIFLWKQAGNALDYTAPMPADATERVPPSKENPKPKTQNLSSPVAAALVALRGLHDQRNQLSFSAFLELCYRELRLVELFALMHRGDQCVANLWKLVDIARAAESAGMTTLRELARYIRDVALDVSEERQSPSVEEGDDVARIITMHSAKGLEWNIVALADLGRWDWNKKETILVDRATGRVELSLRRLKTAQFDTAAAREKARVDAEETRLLYVAATRARDWLIVPFFETGNQRGYFTSLLREDFSEERIASDPSVQRVDRKAIETPKTPLRAVMVEAEEPKARQRGKVERAIAERDQWIARRKQLLAAISQGRPRRRPSQHEEELIAEIVEDDPHGKQIGALVHAALEIVEIKAPLASQKRDAQQFIAAAHASDPVKQRALQLVETALASPLWARLRRSSQVLREVPFCVELDGALVEGFMDVIFEENGNWIIADYKSDAITPAQLEQRAQFYRSQMATYGAAFAKITGKPPAEKILLFLALNHEAPV